MKRDPSRLVIAASGWNDFEVNLKTVLVISDILNFDFDVDNSIFY